MSKATWSFRDNSDEISVTSLHFADVAAGGANFDAVVAGITAVGAALNALTLCEQAKEVLSQNTDDPSPDIPASAYAQREFGLRVVYSDDVTGKYFNITIPGPDLDNVDILAGTDRVVLTDTEMAALITAMEAAALSPDGNAITVQRAYVVGRRN